ncbi:MAG: hypothetical protein KDE09_20920, partial [Anaerolineales bacterium]|nr:hypothetical protein [Anaerolineales bacterium]
VPAAQYHLADALLASTGDLSHRRRMFARSNYLVSAIVLIAVLRTEHVVTSVRFSESIPHLRPGLLFWVFSVYYFVLTALSLRGILVARERSQTTPSRQRMTTIAIVFLAAPISVFPYLIVAGPIANVPILFWTASIAANLVSGIMFSLLTLRLAQFGTTNSDSVVRVRLYKYLARAPLAATIVLLVIVLVGRTNNFLNLPEETSLAVAVVATIIFVEGAIHVYKRPLERFFQLDDDPDVRRVQELSERVLTTREMHEFLESLLVGTVNALQTPTAFIAAIGPDGPKLEVSVGPLAESEALEKDTDLALLEQNMAGSETSERSSKLTTSGSFIIWRDYWIQPLYGRRREGMLGILGIRARGEKPDLTPAEMERFSLLQQQAASALEDRILQQEVFALLEGALPSQAVQAQRRFTTSQASYPELVSGEEADSEAIIEDPDFTTMVRDALSHYWGGPKLSESPLLSLRVVQDALQENGGNPTKALRAILTEAIEMQKPEGERSLTTAKWILYNILEMKVVQGKRVREVARRLAMSESDLYRKQRVAIENVARTIYGLERAASEPANGAAPTETP